MAVAAPRLSRFALNRESGIFRRWLWARPKRRGLPRLLRRLLQCLLRPFGRHCAYCAPPPKDGGGGGGGGGGGRGGGGSSKAARTGNEFVAELRGEVLELTATAL
jgi:hypothetical protein